jgi:hypothetical protein
VSSSANRRQQRDIATFTDRGCAVQRKHRENLQYLSRYHDMALHGAKDALDSRIRAAFVSSSDPELAIDWLLSSLQRHFSSVTVYDSLDALIQAHPDIVVKPTPSTAC